jgi:hypothetical protein
VNDLARCSLFTVLRPKSPPKERMPAIVDFSFLPDMGRMAVRWWWAGIMLSRDLC